MCNRCIIGLGFKGRRILLILLKHHRSNNLKLVFERRTRTNEQTTPFALLSFLVEFYIHALPEGKSERSPL
jgi:hypothetical protein